MKTSGGSYAAEGPAEIRRPARIGCVVMASGEGRRFGSQKLLAELAGVPVLERTLRCVSSERVDAVVVTRSEDVALLCGRVGVPAIVHDGPLHSDTIRRGLDVLDGHAACAFLPGDQPLVTVESMDRLAAEALSHPGCIARLSWNGAPGSPVVFPSGLFGALRSIEGDKGGTSILKARPELGEAVRLVEAGREWELFDIDTKADLARVQDIIVREGL